MSSVRLPQVVVPEEMAEAIEKRRGDTPYSDYIRGLIKRDLPKSVVRNLPPDGVVGRPKIERD